MTMFLAPYTAIADIDGSPLDAGFVYIGEQGKYPESSPVEVFWDSSFNTPAAQPIRTRNGYLVRNGSPAKIYLREPMHSISVKNRNGSTIFVDINAAGLVSTVLVRPSGVTVEQTFNNIDNSLAEKQLQINGKAATEYVNEQLDLKAPKATTYTKIEVDSALSLKAPQSNTYTKAEVDTTLAAYVGGRKAYTTLALAQADQANLTVNTAIEVTNDGANNGTYQWNGTTLTKSAYDPLTQAKAYADANAIFKPVVVNAAIDFNTYKTYGLYYFTTGSVWDSSTNRPSTITNTWAYMLVLPISATVVAQYIWCLNTLKMTYRYCNSSNVWSAWSIFSDDATLTTSILAAADPIIATKISTTLTPMFNAAGKNKFDKSTILTGFVISGAGAVNVSATGVITSLINIKGATSIAISGLQVSVGYRAVRFLREDKTVISVTSVAPGATSLVAAVPASTVYVQFTLKETADTFTLNPDTVQLESGTSATAFEAYVRGNLTSLYGVGIEAASSVGNIKSAAIGAKYLIFGDSITQTSNVDGGVFNQTSYFTQWPTYAYTQLQMGSFRNYAKSGASFRNRSLLPYQYLGYQVEQAIANNELADVIVVSCGTNDGVASLGDYETAMSKSTQGSLDTTLLYEAARYAFWKIRQKWPNAVCFFCVPLQRASADTTALLPMLDGLTKMAGRYGFTIIDQHRESGIIRDLEVQDAAGVFLADGLHPNDVGKQLQANYICAKIISRMAK